MARAAFAFSADGTHAVYFRESGQWVVANAVTGRQWPLGTAFDGMGDCWLSSDNRLLAVSSYYRQPRNAWEGLQSHLLRRRLHVFDTATGLELCQPIRGGSTACFAPDGKTLAVADRDTGLALWDWPPPSPWPRTLALAAATMLGCYGIGFGWSRRRSVKANAEKN